MKALPQISSAASSCSQMGLWCLLAVTTAFVPPPRASINIAQPSASRLIAVCADIRVSQELLQVEMANAAKFANDDSEGSPTAAQIEAYCSNGSQIADVLLAEAAALKLRKPKRRLFGLRRGLPPRWSVETAVWSGEAVETAKVPYPNYAREVLDTISDNSVAMRSWWASNQPRQEKSPAKLADEAFASAQEELRLSYKDSSTSLSVFWKELVQSTGDPTVVKARAREAEMVKAAAFAGSSEPFPTAAEIEAFCADPDSGCDVEMMEFMLAEAAALTKRCREKESTAKLAPRWRRWLARPRCEEPAVARWVSPLEEQRQARRNAAAARKEAAVDRAAARAAQQAEKKAEREAARRRKLREEELEALKIVKEMQMERERTVLARRAAAVAAAGAEAMGELTPEKRAEARSKMARAAEARAASDAKRKWAREVFRSVRKRKLEETKAEAVNSWYDSGERI